jgi:flagella basal body P-ring formation protein FlgA
MSVTFQKSMFFALVLIGSQWSAQAAEIRFRSQAAVGRGLVRLGDIAEVVTTDEVEARLLEGIALVPAPDVAGSRRLKRQEVQQLLSLSGIQLREHHFVGADVTEVISSSAATAVAPLPVTITANRVAATYDTIAEVEVARPAQVSPIVSQATSVEGKVREAVLAHLNSVADMAADWQVEVAYSPRVAQELEQAAIVSVEGGVSPWIGRQQFMLLVGNPQSPQRLPIEAEVSGIVRAVSAARMVEKGTVLSVDDLQFQTVTLKPGNQVQLDTEQLVGRETTRTLNAGQLVGLDHVRSVRLIKRGEDIQVFSIGAGLQIVEPGKALADGAHGDSITVEFADRRKMTARVTGMRRAEVYAMQTVRSQPENTSSPLNRR